MGIEVRWLDHPHVKPGTAILYAFTDPWDWSDYEAATRTWAGLAEETEAATIATLVDLRQTERAPVQAMLKFRTIMANMHPKSGDVLLVGMNWFFRVIADGLSVVFPNAARSLRAFAALDDALAFLAREQAQK